MSDETRDNEGDHEQTSRDPAERLSDSTWAARGDLLRLTRKKSLVRPSIDHSRVGAADRWSGLLPLGEQRVRDVPCFKDPLLPLLIPAPIAIEGLLYRLPRQDGF
jgi:hypothetical protein